MTREYDGLDTQVAGQNWLRESDLYPLLSQFLLTELGIYSMRIDEKRARNQHGPDGNKWLYPDLVGIEDLTANWEREIIDCVSVSSETRSKLYSFEVKRLLNRANVREAFFQAVSNSSWANFPYLVATEKPFGIPATQVGDDTAYIEPQRGGFDPGGDPAPAPP